MRYVVQECVINTAATPLQVAEIVAVANSAADVAVDVYCRHDERVVWPCEVNYSDDTATADYPHVCFDTVNLTFIYNDIVVFRPREGFVYRIILFIYQLIF